MKQEDNGHQKRGMTFRALVAAVFFAVLYSLMQLVTAVIAFTDNGEHIGLKITLLFMANILWILVLTQFLTDTVPDNWAIRTEAVIYLPDPGRPVIAIMDYADTVFTGIIEYDHDKRGWRFYENKAPVTGKVLSWSFFPPHVKLT